MNKNYNMSNFGIWQIILSLSIVLILLKCLDLVESKQLGKQKINSTIFHCLIFIT